MSTSTLRRISRAAGRDDEAGDEERRDRVARRPAGADGDEAGEHGERAGEVAAEVERVRERAPGSSSGARRASETTVRETSIAITTTTAANTHQAGRRLDLDPAGEPGDARAPRRRR